MSKILLFYTTTQATLVLQTIDYYQETLSQPVSHFVINLNDVSLTLLTKQISESDYLLGIGTFSGLLLIADMNVKELEENDSVHVDKVKDINTLKGLKLSLQANLETMISSLSIEMHPQSSWNLTVGNANGFAIHYSHFLKQKLDQPQILEIVKMDQSQVNCVYSFTQQSKSYILVGLYNSKLLLYESEESGKNYKLISVQNTEYSVMVVDGFQHADQFKILLITAQSILVYNFSALFY